MSFTYDTKTNRGKVRLIIADQDSTDPMFDDDEIDAFLSINSDIRLAAAYALGTMATNQVMVLKVIKLLDLTTDGAKVSDALRRLAKDLRDQVANEYAFDIAEMIDNQFSVREFWLKEALRDVA